MPIYVEKGSPLLEKLRQVVLLTKLLTFNSLKSFMEWCTCDAW